MKLQTNVKSRSKTCSFPVPSSFVCAQCLKYCRYEILTIIKALKLNAYLVTNFQQFINLVRWSKLSRTEACISMYARDARRFRPESLSLKTLFLISTILTFELTTQCYKQNNSLILLKRNRSGLSTSNWLTWAKLIETPVFKTYIQYIKKHNELAWNPGWFHFNGCTLEACLIQFNFVTP